MSSDAPEDPQPQKKKQDTIRITVNPMIRAYLEKLKQTGLYGNDHAQAALKLVTGGIERAIGARVLNRIDPPDATEPSSGSAISEE